MNRRQAMKLRTMYNVALHHFYKGRYNEAQKLFTRSAQGGCAYAMIPLASMYYWGMGMEPDTTKAIYWLRRAADKGSHAARKDLAIVYYNMGDSEENNKIAWEYYTQAAQLDKADLFFLGWMNFEHRGIYRDEAQRVNDALVFFQDSLMEGNALSGLYLWKMLKDTHPEAAEAYYDDGEKLLVSPAEYSNWACVLCKWGEPEKALPYIEECLSIEEVIGEENPNHLNAYADCLYDLGRTADAQRILARAIDVCRKRDERRLLRETLENVKSYGFQIEEYIKR